MAAKSHSNKYMKYLTLISFVIALSGCSTNEFDALLNDIKKNEITEFSYEVGGYNYFKCDSLAGQKILRAWSNTLEEPTNMASWPSPDNYLELSFSDGKKYKVKVFIGSDNLKYSVLYTNHVYTGDRLKIESVCPGLKEHNKMLSNFEIKKRI